MLCGVVLPNGASAEQVTFYLIFYSELPQRP
jgi:hypothetical protein